MELIRNTCPCCGYKTLSEEAPGSLEICTVCFWEDDKKQFEDPDFEGGANKISLRKAQRNYAEFGAAEKNLLKYVRKVKDKFERDNNWQLL